MFTCVYAIGLAIGFAYARGDGADARLPGLAGIVAGVLGALFAPGPGFALFALGSTGAACGLVVFSLRSRVRARRHRREPAAHPRPQPR